jgi:hypothetical protein
MAGHELRQVEVRAKVRFGREGLKDVSFTLDDPVVRVFEAPSGYVVVVDDDYYGDHRVVWGGTPKDAVDAYYEWFRGFEDVEVLDAVVAGAEEDWEEEEWEEWEEEMESWEEDLGIEEEDWDEEEEEEGGEE